MKKWIIVLFVNVSIICWADDSQIKEDISFIIEFLAKIHSDHTFTIQDEQKFLGESGGFLGSNLRDRLLELNKTQYLEYKQNISLIGTLLQCKKDFFLDKSAVICIGEIDDMKMRKFNGISFQKMYGMTYIVVIGFLKKDIMSLDNRADICIFALSKKNMISRIDLPHTLINGKRAPAVLGFIDNKNEYNLGLNSSDWEILLKSLANKKISDSR